MGLRRIWRAHGILRSEAKRELAASYEFDAAQALLPPAEVCQSR
jgi:hypothetical protein